MTKKHCETGHVVQRLRAWIGDDEIADTSLLRNWARQAFSRYVDSGDVRAFIPFMDLFTVYPLPEALEYFVAEQGTLLDDADETPLGTVLLRDILGEALSSVLNEATGQHTLFFATTGHLELRVFDLFEAYHAVAPEASLSWALQILDSNTAPRFWEAELENGVPAPVQLHTVLQRCSPKNQYLTRFRLRLFLWSLSFPEPDTVLASTVSSLVSAFVAVLSLGERVTPDHRAIAPYDVAFREEVLRRHAEIDDRPEYLQKLTEYLGGAETDPIEEATVLLKKLLLGGLGDNRGLLHEIEMYIYRGNERRSEHRMDEARTMLTTAMRASFTQIYTRLSEDERAECKSYIILGDLVRLAINDSVNKALDTAPGKVVENSELLFETANDMSSRIVALTENELAARAITGAAK